MPIRKPTQITDFLPPTGRLLGLDTGTKTVGIAVCDPTRSFASPLCVLQRQRFRETAAQLEKLIKENTAVGLVIGLPLNMDGSEGPRCQATRDFADNLLQRQDNEIILWDERLSTASAERAMIEADLSRKRRAQRIDQAAAAVILQSFLDYLRLSGERSKTKTDTEISR